jgi:hypothetical protein
MQRETDPIVLQALRDNNMIFISAQPDTAYFHWQVSLYLYQFSKHGIIDRCYCLFGYKSSPSQYIQNLAKQYPTVKYYKDERMPNDYSPTIRPHLLAKFFRQYPHLGKNVFYHDSDILLTKLPRFDLMLGNDIGYLSDTISYIGYEYLKICASRYKAIHSSLRDLDIFYGMCEVMAIDPELVKANEKNSGGAQYLLKNIDHVYWEECEKRCVDLYTYLSNYEKRYPVQHHIQKWTTDMWVVLWVYWKRGSQTRIHRELDFSWATGTVDDYNRHNIFHLAGITNANCIDKFHKGRYTNRTVFDAYQKNPRIFDHINKNNATYEYVGLIKEYMAQTAPTAPTAPTAQTAQTAPTAPTEQTAQTAQKRVVKSNQTNNRIVLATPKQVINVNDKKNLNESVQSKETKITQFKISTKKFGGIYRLDDNKHCCQRPIWRSIDRQYIIFWNGSCWIVTYSTYERKIGISCGGIASVNSENPYDDLWNVDDLVVQIM